MTYLIVVGSVVFGLVSCAVVFFVGRAFNNRLKVMAATPERQARSANLPLVYHVLNVTSSFALVISLLAFANSGGQPWLFPYRGFATFVAVLSAVCWVLVYIRSRR